RPPSGRVPEQRPCNCRRPVVESARRRDRPGAGREGMSARRPRPILVTGSHRSGSTWVGKMIASHPRVAYVEEPFNAHGRAECPVRHMWHLITDQDEAAFRAYVGGVLKFRHPWGAALRGRPSPRRLAGAAFGSLLGLWRRLRGARPLLKDPVGPFSAARRAGGSGAAAGSAGA